MKRYPIPPEHADKVRELAKAEEMASYALGHNVSAFQRAIDGGDLELCFTLKRTKEPQLEKALKAARKETWSFINEIIPETLNSGSWVLGWDPLEVTEGGGPSSAMMASLLKAALS